MRMSGSIGIAVWLNMTAIPSTDPCYGCIGSDGVILVVVVIAGTAVVLHGHFFVVFGCCNKSETELWLRVVRSFFLFV
jgi:hypothetical protein